MTDAAVPTSSSPERLPRVAFQGAFGAFSELALRQHWPRGVDALPSRSFPEVVARVLSGDADFGVVPMENAIAGRVHAAHDALDEAAERIVRHTDLRVAIHLCVLAPRGATLAGLRIVRSHPMALAQCRIFFARHAWLTPEPHEDTAGAASDVATIGDVTIAAIASDAAADRFGLEVIARHVEDVPANWTRFIVFGARHSPSEAS